MKNIIKIIIAFAIILLCLGNTNAYAQPTQPTQPTQPSQQTQPSLQTQPTQPAQPTQPSLQTQPTQPTQPAQPTQPLKVGDAVDKIYSTDIVANIDGMKIPSYNINGKTAIMLKDLKSYGFSVEFVPKTTSGQSLVYVSTLDKPSTPPTYIKPKVAQSGVPVGDILFTDIIVSVNGFIVPSYNIAGSTAVCIEDLGYMGSTIDVSGKSFDNLNASLGYSNYRFNYVWSNESRTISLNSLRLGVPILTYHHFLTEEELPDDTENDFVVSVENFKLQMAYLYDHGYTTITQKEFYDYFYNHGHIPAKSVMITIDDGYYSNSHYAYPILKQYGFNAVIYTITSQTSAETTEEFDPVLLQFMSKPEIARCSDVFEYDSHTHNMHYFTKENKPALTSSTAENIYIDLQQSASYSYIDNISIAYPFGAYNNDIIKAAKDTGFKFGMTTEPKLVKLTSDPYKLGRYTINRTMPMEKFIQIVSQGDKRLQ